MTDSADDVTGAARFFSVLADDARLRMLWLLFNHRELCVCDFVSALGITQSKASRHLRTLFHAGLVTDRREGLWSYYSLRRLESELQRSHMELLRVTLAGCPEADSLLERVRCCLQPNRAALVAAGQPSRGATPARAERLRDSQAAARPEPRPARGRASHPDKKPAMRST